MSKWRKQLKNEVWNEVKEYDGERIYALYKPNETLMEKMITNVLNNIPYGKYVEYIERISRRRSFTDILSQPFPKDSFFYNIKYKTGESQSIGLHWYCEIYSFPDLFMATIYDYVRRNRKYFKDKLGNCKTDWYFKPSSCLKQYEEIQNLYIATGTNDMVMNGFYEFCNMMQKRKVVSS